MGLNNGLEALYHFTGNANDSSGNGNNGTIVGATLTTDMNAVSNQAYLYDGNDYMYLPNDTFGTLSEGTISMFVKFNSLASDISIFSYGQASHAFDFQIKSGGQMRIWLYDAGYKYDLTTTNSLSTGVWYHIVFKVDSTGNSIWVDGIQWTGTYASGSSSTSGFLSSVLSTNDLCRFGRAYSGSRYFSGVLDEVRVYSRAITEDEVLQLAAGYDTDADSVETLTYENELYYSCDDADLTGSNPDDLSGNGNDGTNNGCTTGVTGKLNQAFNYNGSSNNVITPVGQTSDFTWIAWINPNTDSSFRNVMSLIKTGNTDYRVVIQKNTTNKITFGWDDNTESGVATGSTLSNNTWYLVILTKSGESWNMYLNNSLDASTTTSSFDMTQLTDVVNFGRYATGIVHWSGETDEMGIWNRALTAAERTELWNSGAGKNPYASTPTGSKQGTLFLGSNL